MMHGYIVTDKDGNQLVPFRTWRNNITGEASQKLAELFRYPIPQRWSVAHLYQAILNGEEHVRDIDYLTTLAGYVHWQLTGERRMGVGEASGMFPIDLETQDFNLEMCHAFDEKVQDKGFDWRLRDILPRSMWPETSPVHSLLPGPASSTPPGLLPQVFRSAPPKEMREPVWLRRIPWR